MDWIRPVWTPVVFVFKVAIEYGQSAPDCRSVSLYEPRLPGTFPSYAQFGRPTSALRPPQLTPSPQPLYGNEPRQSLAYMRVIVMSCRMLDRHLVVLACWRALLSAGSKIEISSAMMPMTTSSSTSVKPFRDG